MQTENKLEIYELLVLTSKEATELLLEESKKFNADLRLIEDILTYTLVDVNVQKNDGRTALMEAAYYGKEKVVELLLGYPKIDVNLQSERGHTALIEATIWRREKVIEVLLKHPQIDVSLQNEGGWTAWERASGSIRQKFPQLNPSS
jgi:ankyrin repeat protein